MKYRTNAPRGAKLLDEKNPQWWVPGGISLDTLDLADARNCPLGQLYGSYDEGLEAVFGLPSYAGREAREHGFTLDSMVPGKDWLRLQLEWVHLIAKRRYRGAW